MEILKSVILLGVMGLIFGAVLAFAAQKFAVEVDEREAKILEVLPGANCGGCGFPGCSGYACALVEKKVDSLAACKVSKPEAKEQIKAYLKETPGPDGTTLDLK